MKLTHVLVAIIVVLLVGFVAYVYQHHFEDTQCATQYQFVNSDVACGVPDVLSKVDYGETRRNIIEFIAREQEAGKVSHVSVYFRDLVRGPLMGINETTAFAPASLLKLPLAFAFIQEEYETPGFLKHEISYSGASTASEQHIKPTVSAEPDKRYTIEELLRLMLTYSDNASAEALEAFLQITPERVAIRRGTFLELGLISPQGSSDEIVTVRSYASLFRLLYNSSSLDSEYSELLLKWLAEGDFNSGLVAGVPAGVPVSHKFGERTGLDGEKQLHDCGIVYYPENPYLLCVMTRGSDWDEQTKVISTISKIIYEEVDSRKL